MKVKEPLHLQTVFSLLDLITLFYLGTNRTHRGSEDSSIKQIEALRMILERGKTHFLWK